MKQLPLHKTEMQFIEALEQQANNKQMTLGVFGSFSVGKSALINALIGHQDLLPTHTNETTAIPTYIKGGETDHIEAYHFNGMISELNVIKLHSLTAGVSVNDIESIVIERQTPSWLKEIIFIDTPGRNTKYKAHIDASEQALITSDAALYVMPWQGLTLEDIVYLKHILRYQPNLYFVINKVDRIDEAQGITIEEMQQRVTAELKEQLGRDFPVYAVSAKTGYNMDKLYLEFILPLKNELAQLKEHRLQYALKQLLMREQERIVQQVEFYEKALSSDEHDSALQKQAVQMQYADAQIEVSNQMEALLEIMFKTEEEMKQYMQKCYQLLEVKLKNLVKENLSIDELTLKIENEIVTTRNEVFGTLYGRIQKIVGDEGKIELKSPDEISFNFKMPVPNLSVLQNQYEAERERAFAKINAVKTQLQLLPESSGNDEQRERLLLEIENLTEQAVEKFVPEYILDETFDPNKSEKIASAIGFVGDMALTVALAVATAGTSAAAQVGGKVVAKEATKTAAKTAAKKVASEAAEKAIIAGISIAAEASKKPGNGSDNTVLKAAKALDQFTSPVQTIAKKIGQQIDETRRQPKKEDMQHRRQFFERKKELETLRDDKLHQLDALENQAANNERIRKELTLKREQVEQAMKHKLKKLEENYEEETNRIQNEHLLKEINSQLEQVLTDEEQYLTLWFKTEFANLLNVLDQMLPRQLKEQLQHWEQQITDVEQMKESDTAKIQQLIDENRAYLNTIESLVNGEQYAVAQ